MTLAWALVVVLAVALAAALAVAGVFATRLRAERERADALEATVRRVDTPAPRAAQVAGLAVRQVSRTAARVRDQGLVAGLLVGSIDDFSRWALEDRSEIVRHTAADGTVTVLFSDIVDSTARNEHLGDPAWVRLLAAHDRLARSAFGRRGGHVVKTQGDGFMVVFADPAEAVGAALDLQRALRTSRSRRLRRTPIEVRIGLHTGSAIERDGDFFGRNVALAARVAARATGGEVLVSDDVRERLPSTDGRFVLEDAGTADLKGLGEHRLWRVTA